MKFTYLSQPPKKFTFQMPKVKLWVEENCEGKVLNLFAGITRLDLPEIRVDVNKEMVADYYMDAYEFVKTKSFIKFDTIILDPPYNLRKAREKYQGKYIGKLTKLKNELSNLLNPGGIIISFGYATTGMSKSRGFKKEHILVICHNGDHNDTLVVIERKIGG